MRNKKKQSIFYVFKHISKFNYKYFSNISNEDLKVWLVFCNEGTFLSINGSTQYDNFLAGFSRIRK